MQVPMWKLTSRKLVWNESVCVRKGKGIGSQCRLDSKTVHVGWKSYDKLKDTFISVQYIKGGCLWGSYDFCK